MIIPLALLIAAVTVGAVTWKGGPARGAAAPPLPRAASLWWTGSE